MEDGQSSSPLPYILNTKELHSIFSGVSTLLSSNTSSFDASPQSNVSVMGVYSKVVTNLKDEIFGLQHEPSTVENLDLNNVKLHVKTDNFALTIPSQLSASIDTESADLNPDIEFINNPLTTQVLSLNNAYSVDHLPKNDPFPHDLNLSNALSPTTLSDLASFFSGSAKVHSVDEPSSVPTSKPVIVTQGPMKMTTKLVSFTHELKFLSPYTFMRISPSELGESPRELSNAGITGIHSNSSNDRSTSSKIDRPNSEMFLLLSKSVSTTSETNSSTNDFQTSTLEPKSTTSKRNYSNFEPKSSTLDDKSFISEPKSSTFSPTSETKFSSELQFTASEPKSSTASPKSSTSESKSSIYEPNSSNFKTVSSTLNLKSPTAEKKPSTFEPEFSTTELVISTSEHESFTTGIVTATSEPELFTTEPVLYYETESFQFEPIFPTYQAEPFSNDKLVTATPDLEFSPFDRLFTSTNSELVPSGTMLFTSEQVSSTDVTIPPTSEPVPSTNAPIPPTSEPVPSTNAPIPPTPEAVPSTNAPIPPTSEPVPSTNAPIPPTSEPVPSTNALIPPTSEAVPSTSAPIPTTSGHVLVTQEQLPIPKSELKSIHSNSVTFTSEKVSESSPASIATLESESSSESLPINSDPGFISHEPGTDSNFLDSPVKNILEQDYSEPDILLVDGLITKNSLEHNVDVTSVTELEVGNPGEHSVSSRLKNLNRMTTQIPLLNSSDSSTTTGVNKLLNFDSVGYMDNDAPRIDGKFQFHNSLPMSNLAFYSILLTSLSLAAVLLMVIFAFAYRRRSMKRKVNLSHVKVPSHCDVSFENEFLRPPSSSWTCAPSGSIDFQDSLLTKSLPPAILPAEIDSIYLDQNLSRAYTNFAFDSSEEMCHNAARVYSLNRSVVQSANDITPTSVEQLSGSQQGTVLKVPSYQNSVAGSAGDGASCEKTSSSCPAANDCVHEDQNSSSRDVRSSPLMSGSPLTPPRSQHSNDSLTSSSDPNSKNTSIDHTKMPCFMKNKGNNEAAKEQFQHINFDAKDVHDLAAEYENALNEGSFLAVHPSYDVKSDEITRVKSTSFFVTALIHDSDR